MNSAERRRMKRKLGLLVFNILNLAAIAGVMYWMYTRVMELP